MTVESPRSLNLGFSLGHILQEIFEKEDEAFRLEEGGCKILTIHISNYLWAMETGGDKDIVGKVVESRKKLREMGVSEEAILRSEVIAAGQTAENLAEKVGGTGRD